MWISAALQLQALTIRGVRWLETNRKGYNDSRAFGDGCAVVVGEVAEATTAEVTLASLTENFFTPPPQHSVILSIQFTINSFYDTEAGIKSSRRRFLCEIKLWLAGHFHDLRWVSRVCPSQRDFQVDFGTAETHLSRVPFDAHLVDDPTLKSMYSIGAPKF